MRIGRLAKVIRTKNAGPYVVSADIIFANADVYQRIKDSGIVTPDLVARLYGVERDVILGVIFFDPARCIKINIKRPRPAGDLDDADVLGMQQHVPLLGLEIPDDLLADVRLVETSSVR